MTADYSVSCTSSRYYFAFIWALGMIFIYPLGCPALYFYLLYTHRVGISTRNPSTSFFFFSNENEMTAEERKIYSLRFLFHSYHPHLWWWEMIETANRLLLTGLLVLIEQGSAIQIVIGILLSLLFIHLYDHFHPFDDHVIATIKNISQWQIFFVFFIALLFKANFSSIDSTALTGILIVVIFLNLLLDFMKILYSLLVTPVTEYDKQPRHTSSSPTTQQQHDDDEDSGADNYQPHQHRHQQEQSREEDDEGMRQSLVRMLKIKTKNKLLIPRGEDLSSQQRETSKDMEMTSSPLNHEEKLGALLSSGGAEDGDQV
jgi:hypothetical protein